MNGFPVYETGDVVRFWVDENVACRQVFVSKYKSCVGNSIFESKKSWGRTGVESESDERDTHLLNRGDVQ